MGSYHLATIASSELVLNYDLKEKYKLYVDLLMCRKFIHIYFFQIRAVI